MKWVAGAGAVLGVAWTWWSLTYVLPLPDSVGIPSLVFLVLAECGIPVAIGIAVMRYRLYGIDVLIRRTVTYTALVAVLAAVYLCCVVVLEAGLEPRAAGWVDAVTLSKLAVAALFGPGSQGTGRQSIGVRAACTRGRGRGGVWGGWTRSTWRRSRWS